MKQELKPLKTGSLQIAVKDKKIFQLTNSDELEKVLRYCMLLVGLRATNLPGKEEKAILINHILKDYSGHTVAEIRLAFDMAVNGELDLDHKDVVCYENFSVIYFCSIMNAYRLWASQEYRQIIKDEPTPQRIYTDDELDNLMRKDIEIAYQQMRNGKIPYGLPDEWKAILITDGLMKTEQSLADFFVQRLGKQIRNIYVPA